MPEGPSIYIIKEELRPIFKGRTIRAVTGKANVPEQPLKDQKLIDIKTFGKQLLLCTRDCTISIHFLMFGVYSIDKNDKPTRQLKLGLKFNKGSLYFYTCSVKFFDQPADEVFDAEADVMNKKWSVAKARKKLKDVPGELVCDALLDQSIFAGVGNIIKNEVLYRVRIHPESKVGKIPARKITALIKESVRYTFDFLKQKKADTLAENWQAYTKKKCGRCDLPMKKKYLGKTKRRTFYCDNCQEKY